MTDVLTVEQRHRCMSRIRGKDTGPEMCVRHLVHRMGYRYRLHVAGLPGKPDIVLARLRKVIFVHGCFWHMHRCRMGRVRPSTNADFWKAKREGNRKRDARKRQALKRAGWGVLTIWECDLRAPDRVAKKLRTFLDASILRERTADAVRRCACRKTRWGRNET